jgi:hypothetical protein
MQAWDFLVDRVDLSKTEVRAAGGAGSPTLADGEVLFEIERFSLTANNITYGVVGEQLGYWRFFPAPDGWGRIPVWGFARAVASRAADVEEGTRLYGYWPMSSHFVARFGRSGSGFLDQAEHRAALPAAYNRYEPAPETSQDDHLALLRPLFTTSFLLDDYLAEIAPGATAILSSASSRTAIGLAWMLARRGQPALGLTSSRNKSFVEGLALYQRVVTYDELAGLELGGPIAFIDMAGDAGVRAAVHQRFHDQLVHSAIVGGTHHEARAGDGAPLPGPRPAFFFAPDRLQARRQDWGAASLSERVVDSMNSFIADSDWLKVRHHRGPDALASVYQAVLAGEASPAEGHVILP